MTRFKHGGSPRVRMSVSTVYFVPASVQYTADRDVLSLENILSHRRYPFLSRVKTRGVVGIKPCEIFAAVALRYCTAFVHLLQTNERSAFLCGTSDRHLDHESNGIVNAYNTMQACPAPYLPLDGLYGEHEITGKSCRNLESHVYLAGELPNLDGLISVSCFSQTDSMTPCGSVANLGQGLASKKGKIHQRTTRCPQVHTQKCYACRRCVRACPTRAISIVDGQAAIDRRKCVKCGKCVEVAHYGGITHDWNATTEHYSHAVAQHAKAALALLDNRVTCINVITSDPCDPQSFAGAMVSNDPVAVDSATLEYCRTHDLLQADSIQRGRALLTAAQAIGVGTDQYDQEKVAY